MKTGSAPKIYRNSTAYALSGGTLNRNPNSVTITTPVADLLSYTIPREFIASLGDTIRFSAAFLGNSGAPSFTCYIDGVSQVAVSMSATDKCHISGEFMINSTPNMFGSLRTINQFGSLGVSFIDTVRPAGEVTILFTGRDITQKYLFVDWTPGA